MKKLEQRFVENIPDTLEEGVLYVSVQHETVIHKCCCGCRQEVVTPLSPSGWSLIFNGETISLKPSIGNWNFECKSHYWIKNNRIHWSSEFSEQQIQRVQLRDLNDNKARHDNSEQSSNRTKWSNWFKKLF